MRLRDLLSGRSRNRSGRTDPLARPRVEQLEDRTLLNAATQEYVTNVFRALFRREPPANVVAGLAQVLDVGNVPRPNFILALEGLPEFRTRQVDDLARLLLNRPADAALLGRFTPQLAAGAPVEQVAAQIAASDEYFAQVSGGTVDGFLNTLFLDALNRPIDAPSRDVLAGSLAAGASRLQVATFVFSSPEYFRNVVQTFFVSFLNRPAVDPDLAFLATTLATRTASTDQLIAAILSADEFVRPPADEVLLTARVLPDGTVLNEVQRLLDRAVVATASNDAIIAILDRNGRILGVRVEDGVAPEIRNDPEKLTFAIDGAIAKARTGAFFGNNQAPLTSRTIQEISQTTMTQREIESDPNLLDPFQRGPGFVAPIGIKSHFPADTPQTPQVDLFAIEHTNRDSINHPGPNFIRQVGADGLPLPGSDDIRLRSRFNADPTFIPPGKALTPPESYGFASGVFPSGQSRGVGTLPGGIPVVKNGQVVGGIGVFFPGRTGFASEENSRLNVNFDPNRPDRSFEAEYIAFAAVGGSANAAASVGAIAGIAPVPGIGLLSARIDLVGITLELFGPGGIEGPENLLSFGRQLGVGDPTRLGTPQRVDPAGTLTIDGRAVPSGYLVLPHDSADGSIRAEDVNRIIQQGINQAIQTRAAIRVGLFVGTDGTVKTGLPEAFAAMVFAVTDKNGEILGLFRMPDATIFSIDVAVAKARNVAYYADATALQPQDQLRGIPAGTAFTNRTFRYVALPRFPEGIDGNPPAPFSILNDGGVNPLTGLEVGPRLPSTAFQSVQGFDAFNPGSNFRDPSNFANQNGIVFFPGSTPVFTNRATPGALTLAGGFGVSGDGVDQDDVVTFAGAVGFGVPPTVARADQVTLFGVRLPFQKFNRKPQAG